MTHPANATRYEDIGRLEVSMNEILLVRRCGRSTNLFESIESSLRGKTPLTREECIEGLAFQVLHHDYPNRPSSDPSRHRSRYAATNVSVAGT